jgi:hypothetical protein
MQPRRKQEMREKGMPVPGSGCWPLAAGAGYERCRLRRRGSGQRGPVADAPPRAANKEIKNQRIIVGQALLHDRPRAPRPSASPADCNVWLWLWRGRAVIVAASVQSFAAKPVAEPSVRVGAQPATSMMHEKAESCLPSFSIMLNRGSSRQRAATVFVWYGKTLRSLPSRAV